MSTTITIGRNVGSEPMQAESWKRFRMRTLEAVRTHCESVYFVGTGAGIYEGMREDSFTVIGSDITGDALRFLRNELAALATSYRQESIALTVGATRLVS